MNKLLFGIWFLFMLSACLMPIKVDKNGTYVHRYDRVFDYKDTFFLFKDKFALKKEYRPLGNPYFPILQGFWVQKRNNLILNTHREKPIAYTSSYTVLASKSIESDSIHIYFITGDERDNLLELSLNFAFLFQLNLKSSTNKDSILRVPDYEVTHFEYPDYPNAIKISFFRPKNMVIDTSKDNIFEWIGNSLNANFDWLKNPNHNHFVIAFNTLGEPFVNKKMRIKKNTLIETYTNPMTKKKEKKIYKKIPTF